MGGSAATSVGNGQIPKPTLPGQTPPLQGIGGPATGPMPGDANYPNYTPNPQPGSPGQQQLTSYGPNQTPTGFDQPQQLTPSGGFFGASPKVITTPQPLYGIGGPAYTTPPMTPPTGGVMPPRQMPTMGLNYPIENKPGGFGGMFGQQMQPNPNPYANMQRNPPAFRNPPAMRNPAAPRNPPAPRNPSRYSNRNDAIFEALFDYLGRNR